MTESLTFLAHGAFAALAFEALLSDAETGSLSVGNTVLSELVAWPSTIGLLATAVHDFVFELADLSF